MPSISLAQAAFKRLDAPWFPLRNCYFEALPANPWDQVSIIQRGGLVQFMSLGLPSTAIRGFFRQPGTFSGDYVIAAGTKLYRVTPFGIITELGTISGTGRVVMAGDGSTVLVATGGTLYSTDGTTVSTVSFPDSAGVVSVATINGYFIAVRAGSQRYYFSAVGAATFDPLDFLAAENAPDNLRGMAITGDQLWLFGEGSVEVHVPTGDPDAPFQRVSGRLFGHGCANADSITKVGELICWVGEDRIAYTTASGTPTRISDHGLEEKLRAAEATTFKGWTYSSEGHEFWCIGIGDETHAWDTGTNLWHEVSSYGRAGFRGHCSPYGVNPSALPLVGDDSAGIIWEFDPDVNTDAGSVMSREFSGLSPAEGRTRCDNVYIDATVGRAGAVYPDDDPQIQMRWSDDRGKTWSSWSNAPLGRQGRFNHEPVWKGLGAFNRPCRIFHWRVTDNVAFTARRAKLNEWRAR